MGVSAFGHIFSFGTSGSWNHIVIPSNDENFGMRQSVSSQLLTSDVGQPVKRFKCDKCGKMYTWKQGLLDHLRFVCGKDPQFHCNICTYKSHRKGNFTRHMISLHKVVPQMKQ
jgi:hypothetical protein